MKKPNRPLVVAGLVAAIAGALTLGVVGGQAIASSFQVGQGSEEAFAHLAPIQENDAGQSYGSVVQADSTGNVADLVLVMGDNGNVGYVYSDELYPPPPASPEEALREQAEEPVRVFNVYLADGRTVIDTFTAGANATTSGE